jgi:hypothetical protein
MSLCQKMYYAMCRDSKIKANKIWASVTIQKGFYLVESPLYGISEEIGAHCGWCAKTKVIGRIEKFEEDMKKNE